MGKEIRTTMTLYNLRKNKLGCPPPTIKHFSLLNESLGLLDIECLPESSVVEVRSKADRDELSALDFTLSLIDGIVVSPRLISSALKVYQLPPALVGTEEIVFNKELFRDFQCNTEYDMRDHAVILHKRSSDVLNHFGSVWLSEHSNEPPTSAPVHENFELGL
ncbi:hypothetical protein Tco_1211753 [Tanacetum coccineum]